MILHHVAQRAGIVVVPSPLLHSHRFGDGDLHVIDVAPVPDRLEERIGKPEGEDVLHRLLAQVVIDAVNLVFTHVLPQLAVQRLRRLQIAAKGLFKHNTAPVPVLFAS